MENLLIDKRLINTAWRLLQEQSASGKAAGAACAASETHDTDVDAGPAAQAQEEGATSEMAGIDTKGFRLGVESVGLRV